MIREVTMYQAVCDGCSATEDAFDSGWAEIDGKLYCPDCYEYNKETGEYKPKVKEE